MSDEASIRRLRRRLKHAVEDDSLVDVERLLRGQSKAVVNEAASLSNGSTLLHDACSQGLEQIAVCLVSGGVDVSSVDADLNTPLHSAVRRLQNHRSSRSWSSMSSVILTLLWAKASIYNAENGLGMSPRHLLQPMIYSLRQKKKKRSTSASASPSFDHERFMQELEAVTSSDASAETEWQEKLMHSALEDVDEADGSEWRFFDDGYQYESLSDYMTRLGDTLSRKRHQQRHASPQAKRKPRKSSASPPPKRKTLGPLKPEVRTRKPTATRLPSDHDMQFLRMLQSAKEKGATLFEHDIPWPCRGPAAEMAKLLVDGVAADKIRLHIHRLLRRWHPDKFVQHLGAVLAAEDRERVIQRVTALSQALTALLPTT
ncbi:NF-kappa-B inhibitor-like protein 1 [Sycon ciliatum]|uniref:NF-kappa-B inhibitor-like protein 1 n=1 Tax=Sycon ciliatum TaxID=27933 RepID=UPI0031F6A01B|eukprot:scpid24035/ scgid13783/ 